MYHNNVEEKEETTNSTKRSCITMESKIRNKSNEISNVKNKLLMLMLLKCVRIITNDKIKKKGERNYKDKIHVIQIIASNSYTQAGGWIIWRGVFESII